MTAPVPRPLCRPALTVDRVAIRFPGPARRCQQGRFARTRQPNNGSDPLISGQVSDRFGARGSSVRTITRFMMCSCLGQLHTGKEEPHGIGCRTRQRSPEVSSTAFAARPPDLLPRPLMALDFVTSCLLVRLGRPRIRFLSIGPRFFAPRFLQTPPHGDALALR
jgi:hypothetical protein